MLFQEVTAVYDTRLFLGGICCDKCQQRQSHAFLHWKPYYQVVVMLQRDCAQKSLMLHYYCQLMFQPKCFRGLHPLNQQKNLITAHNACGYLCERVITFQHTWQRSGWSHLHDNVFLSTLHRACGCKNQTTSLELKELHRQHTGTVNATVTLARAVIVSLAE